MTALASLLAAVALAGPAPVAAVNVAKAHVTNTFGISRLSDVTSLRSRRNSTWALVDGFYAKPKRAAGPGIWAVWLRLREGRWLVRYAGIDARAVNPPAKTGVPCDIQPAFSEPLC